MIWKSRSKPASLAEDADAAAPLGPIATNGSVLEELRAKLVELAEGELSADAIDPAGHMLDQGYISSLSAVTFVAHIEDRYGVRIEDIDLVGRLRSLESLAAHVQQHQ